MDRYQQLIDDLIREKYLVSPHMISAFRSTPRRGFLRRTHKHFHSLNSPLPIGDGQTISQPVTVAFMLSLLNPEPGNKILEIGYGSGWQTALLAKLVIPDRVGPQGKIFAYEIIPDIAQFGKDNLTASLHAKTMKRVRLYREDYRTSFAKHSPYDRIIAAAAFDTQPTELTRSLSARGILVYPTSARDIRKITRSADDTFTEEIYPGFVFVPITHTMSSGHSCSRSSR